MFKDEFIKILSTDEKISDAEARRALNMVFNGLIKVLQKGEKVTFMGLGTFYSKEVSAKEGINPQTRQKINIPAYKQVRFKVGKKFKELINNPENIS